MTKDERRGDISNRLTDHIEATNTQSRMRRELWSSHTVTVDFIEAEIEAAVAAERERIIAELERKIRREKKFDMYDGHETSYNEGLFDGYNSAIKHAINIVKGGDDETNK